MRKYIVILIGLTVVGLVYTAKITRENQISEIEAILDEKPIPGSNPNAAPAVAPTPLPEATAQAAVSAQAPAQVGSEAPFELTAANFEDYVKNCFQGQKCVLVDDPWKMYSEYKLAGNVKANDDLISFLRSKLSDPNSKDKYKDPLQKMIRDFYPPEEIPFQEAAYYNYLGDLNKSLALYLDLEKKHLNNPKLRPAPKLNIANTFYELKRYREALPYYQASWAEYISGQQKSGIPSQNEMIRFIEGRIQSIKALLEQGK